MEETAATNTVNLAPIVISDTTVIVVTICATIIFLTVIFLIGKFKITGPNGMSFEVGHTPPEKPDNQTMQPGRLNDGVITQNEKQDILKE